MELAEILFCPPGQHRLIRDIVNDTYVCSQCGVEAEEISRQGLIYASDDIGRMSSADDHQPEDPLKITNGTQHDMSSPKNKGLCMELNDVYHVRDFNGGRVKEQLTFPYVTGQLVGKGSTIIEEDRWDVTFDCKFAHFVTLEYNPRDQGKTRMECGKCHKEYKIRNVYHYKVPIAKKSFTDDTIYRNAKINANNLSTRFDMDPVQRRFYGQELNKIFSEWVSLSAPLLARLALLRMPVKYCGLSVDLSPDVLREYHTMLEKVKEKLVSPLEAYKAFVERSMLPMAPAARRSTQ